MTQSSDPFNLERFLQAQRGVHEQALAEIQDGQKSSHWMWFIFPQLDGLGSSPTAKRYAITSADEAKAYLREPVLGARLLQCAEATLQLQGLSAAEIFGYPDDMKLRSCATLFAHVSPPGSVFEKVLEKYFGRHPDEKTLQLLGERG